MILIKLAVLGAVAVYSPLEAGAAELVLAPGGHGPGHGQGEQRRPVDRDRAQELYRSPFADYRPFSVELSPKGWRRANEEVHDAGGHIGIMKRQPAQLKGHGAHGSKQVVPPVSGERK